jgi:histone deacetylase 6
MAYTGSMVVKVENIQNPTETGASDTIIIKTYDGVNNIILERSYWNLDPASFIYTIPGPMISVNNNNTIIVERGTQSADIPISLVYPCALNLTIVPTTAPGVLIIPS